MFWGLAASWVSVASLRRMIKSRPEASPVDLHIAISTAPRIAKGSVCLIDRG
jgi:hypothetical protein